MDDLRPETIRPIIKENIIKEATLHTDVSSIDTKVGTIFADHQMTVHSAKEYVRGIVHTNIVEGYFSIFKCRFKGVYQHCSKQHLHQLDESDFWYNDRMKLGCGDSEWAEWGVVGKRLTHRQLYA